VGDSTLEVIPSRRTIRIRKKRDSDTIAAGFAERRAPPNLRALPENQETRLAFSQRLREIRTGFESAFWVANLTELFERLAYYGTTAVLAIYLHENLKLSLEQTGDLMGFFGFVVWFLPVLGGTLADRFGFRRALMFAYGVMTLGYFLLGSLSAPWMSPLHNAIDLKWLVGAILIVPALGPAVVKPCVAGTTGRASKENVRSIGYSIYYTLVNVGGTLGPIVASLVRQHVGIESVFRVSALSVFLMFWVTLLFFREPKHRGEEQVPSVLAAVRNMVVILGNLRFVAFLLIYSGYWIVFWQEYVSVPLFVRGYVNPKANVDALLSIDALTVICLQLLVTFLTRKIATFPALTLGIFVSSIAWIPLALHPAISTTIVALATVALGEIIQSPRYYEYISRLAPASEQGLYMGYAFLPIAIGYLIAGKLGGYLLHLFGDILRQPQTMWWVVVGIGILTAFLMWIYNLVVKPQQETTW
jgi:proton-dependent oligopeptide transporter, POT family